MNHFSVDLGPKFTKFGTELPQLPKNPNKHKYLKQIFYKWGKNPKNLLGVFSQVKSGLKKILSQKEFFLEKALFAETPPSSKKNGLKVWKIGIHKYFH